MVICSENSCTLFYGSGDRDPSANLAKVSAGAWRSVFSSVTRDRRGSLAKVDWKWFCPVPLIPFTTLA